MKQFMVLAACLPLLLVFLVQFSLDQINSSRAGIFSDAVYAAKEKAKQEGCFTEEIRDELRQTLSERLGIDPSSVFIEADETPVYRVEYSAGSDPSRGLIHYRVSVPIGEMMAGRRLFGISGEDNVRSCVIESRTPSELIMPPDAP